MTLPTIRTVYVWIPTHLEPDAFGTGPHLVYPKTNPAVGELTYCGRRMMLTDISNLWAITMVIACKRFCDDCRAAFVAEELRSEDIRDADG